MNGKWGIAGTCDQYLDCTNGVERLVTCQNHLVYDDASGNCEHPDAANRAGCTAERAGCTAEELYGFSCPRSIDGGRYAAESDYRAFFTYAVYTNYYPRLSMVVRSTQCLILPSNSAMLLRMFPTAKR